MVYPLLYGVRNRKFEGIWVGDVPFVIHNSSIRFRDDEIVTLVSAIGAKADIGKMTSAKPNFELPLTQYRKQNVSICNLEHRLRHLIDFFYCYPPFYSIAKLMPISKQGYIMHFFGWLRPKLGPKLPETTRSNLLMKIDDEFDKSKRNLLWYSTLAVLIASATWSNQSSECLAFTMAGNFRLSPAFLSTLLLLYGLYLWWMFDYRLKRVAAINTPEFHKLEEDRFHLQIRAMASDFAKHRKEMDAYGKLNVAETEKKLNLILGKIDHFKFEKQNNKLSEERLDDLSKKILSIVDDFIREHRLKSPSASQEADNAVNRVSAEINSAISSIEMHIKNSAVSLDKQIRSTLRSTNESEGVAKYSAASLGDISESVNKLEKSVGDLSSDIRQADVQKFNFSDTFVPHSMAGLASLLMVFTSFSPLFSKIPYWSCVNAAAA